MNSSLLLINLGSPDSPSVPDVRRYLREFLMDPYVIDIPWPIRWAVVNLAILPTRPKESAHAYSSVWTPEGSPLLTNTFKFANKLTRRVTVPVEVAMRYGTPSIPDGINALVSQGIDEIIVVPMYPHYAMSSVTTVVERVQRTIQALPRPIQFKILPPFYKNPAYIDALASSIRAYDGTYDHLLFSYHGLPERHLRKTDPTGIHCLRQPQCCDTPSDAHATCYRHQVFQTTHHVATALNLSRDRWSVAFQSRLGKDPWLTPFTDIVISDLAKQGIRRLAVVCPAFVADCLETIEEIGDRAKSQFLEEGGEHFELIPCLNDADNWIDAMVHMTQPLLHESL